MIDQARFRPIAFLAAVAVQLLVLGWMVAQRVHLRETGARLLLKCEPIDPRSILSGDYVILNYSISRFNGKQLKSLNRFDESFHQHETVYVAVSRPDGQQFHQAVAISNDRTKLQREFSLILRATALNTYQTSVQHYGSLRLRYGVEHYFVPQKQGLAIERNIDRTSVELAVSATGETAIRRLFVEGQEVDFY